MRGGAEPHPKSDPVPLTRANLDDATQRVDAVGQPVQTRAGVSADRAATVVDIERGGAVGCLERDAAGARAAMFDDVRHRLAESPGNGGLVRRINARGDVV